MNFRGDCHLHSTYSDGELTPGELVELAAGRDLQGIAIVDHDAVEGSILAYQYAKSHYPSLKVISGVELSSYAYERAKVRFSLDILGYGFDPYEPHLQGLLQQQKHARHERHREIVERLGRLGIELPSKAHAPPLW